MKKKDEGARGRGSGGGGRDEEGTISKVDGKRRRGDEEKVRKGKATSRDGENI